MDITNQIIEKHGLKLEEYKTIQSLLKRNPNLLELGIFSAMWNEHCSYKSSRIHLKKLPTKGKKVIQGPGENAGVIDIGDDDAIVFKIESHNHPSYIEPYQGAATGVGGGFDGLSGRYVAGASLHCIVGFHPQGLQREPSLAATPSWAP